MRKVIFKHLLVCAAKRVVYSNPSVARADASSRRCTTPALSITEKCAHKTCLGLWIRLCPKGSSGFLPMTEKYKLVQMQSCRLAWNLLLVENHPCLYLQSSGGGFETGGTLFAEDYSEGLGWH